MIYCEKPNTKSCKRTLRQLKPRPHSQKIGRVFEMNGVYNKANSPKKIQKMVF